MSARASLITDRNSVRDIFEPLLCPRLFVDGLESSRAEIEGNADDATRRFMSRLGLLDPESLLGWNGMLLEGFGWKDGTRSGGGSKVFCE
jgi:hypothetical protein